MAQVYTTMKDALNGAYAKWRNRGLPIYPIIVTLEEWYLYGIYGEKILPVIDQKARKKLASLNIDLNLLDQHPYSIISVNDLELAIQFIQRHSINAIMNERCRGAGKNWMFYGFLQEKFYEDFHHLNTTLFPEERTRINPLIAH